MFLVRGALTLCFAALWATSTVGSASAEAPGDQTCAVFNAPECPQIQTAGDTISAVGVSGPSESQASGPGAGVPVWDVLVVAECGPSGVEGRVQDYCGESVAPCPPEQHRVWVWLRPHDQPDAPFARQAGSRCVGGAVGTAVDFAGVREEVTRRVPHPALVVQPADSAVVGLPTLVHTPVVEPVSFDVSLPLPGTVRAIPHYDWAFGDGAGATDAGPGRAYDGTSPREAPAGYYVAHTYTAPAPAVTITLTVTWVVTFTPSGGPTLDAGTLTLTAATSLPVAEAPSELVAG